MLNFKSLQNQVENLDVWWWMLRVFPLVIQPVQWNRTSVWQCESEFIKSNQGALIYMNKAHKASLFIVHVILWGKQPHKWGKNIMSRTIYAVYTKQYER